jgi:hypothetical protein
MTTFDPTAPRIDDGTFTFKNQSVHELNALTFDKPETEADRQRALYTARTLSAKLGFSMNGGRQERVTRITAEQAEARWDAREPITYGQLSTDRTSGATFTRHGEGEDGIELSTFLRDHADGNSRARAGSPGIFFYKPSRLTREQVTAATPVRIGFSYAAVSTDGSMMVKYHSGHELRFHAQEPVKPVANIDPRVRFYADGDMELTWAIPMPHITETEFGDLRRRGWNFELSAADENAGALNDYEVYKALEVFGIYSTRVGSDGEERGGWSSTTLGFIGQKHVEDSLRDWKL